MYSTDDGLNIMMIEGGIDLSMAIKRYLMHMTATSFCHGVSPGHIRRPYSLPYSYHEPHQQQPHHCLLVLSLCIVRVHAGRHSGGQADRRGVRAHPKAAITTAGSQVKLLKLQMLPLVPGLQLLLPWLEALCCCIWVHTWWADNRAVATTTAAAKHLLGPAALLLLQLLVWLLCTRLSTATAVLTSSGL